MAGKRKIPVWIWYVWPVAIAGIVILLQMGPGSKVNSSAGEKLYKKHCLSCHMDDGMGLGKLVPPLAGADYVIQAGPELACVIRYGLSDTILVNGQEYGRPMPGLPDLPAVEVRSILAYIRSAWGNDASAFSFDEVRDALEQCDTTTIQLP